MSERWIGVGILGAGMVTSYHHRAVLACADLGAHLVGVGHPNPARSAEIAATFGAPRMEPAELLAHPEAKLVCICTPSGQHASEALAAIAADKHVLVEKPMALSLADADTMIAAADAAGVRLGVALQRRAEPQFQQLQAAVAAGELGKLTLGLMSIPYYRTQRYYNQAAWRGTWAYDGGGVLMNQGIHLLDLLLWLMGDPVEVQAQAATLQRTVEVEDTLAATLRFADSALATVAATTTAEPGFPHRVEIYGTRGGVQIESEGLLAGRVWAANSAWPSPLRRRGSGGDPPGIAPTGHIRLLRDMIAAVREGCLLLVDGAEGRRSLATVLAVYARAGLPLSRGA
jgi:predicted dehydrogenase